MGRLLLENYTRQATRQFLADWLEYRTRQDSLVGLSVAASVRGRIIFSKAYGMAGEPDSVPLTADHLFCVASQTKMLTAALIMRAIDDNRLHLDDAAVKYIPWLCRHTDSRVHAITVRHLVMHGAGLLRDGNAAAHWLGDIKAPSASQLKSIVLKHPLVFQPGSGAKYSNIGYGLLGMILENVYAHPYADLITELLKSLGIEGGINTASVSKHQIARGYGIPVSGVREPFPATALQLQGLVAAAGLYATPRAMNRLVHELFIGSSVISQNSQKQMLAVQNQVQDGYDEGLKFGFGVEHQQVGDSMVVGHTGHAAGHVSATLCDTEQQLVVSVAANAKDTPTTSIARGIMGALHFFMTPSKSGGESLSHFNARLGNKMSTVQIVAATNRLVMIDPDDWEPWGWHEELEKVNETTLRCITKNSVYNGGELLVYRFEESRIVDVTVAGFPFRPL